MAIWDFLNRIEPLVTIDIGSSSIKLLELDLSGEKPKLVNLAVSPLDEEVFSNNMVTKSDIVSERIMALLEANNIGEQRVTIAMPGPSVFTKKIKMAKVPPAELAANVQFEAGSFIPHNIDAVKIDYHVVGESGKNQLDVLVVAVKNEIVNSFIECLSLSGLEAAVVDVDYFALQNCFELNYPEYVAETVALIDIGARYSSINICKDGESLFTGDIAVGGKLFTDAIADGLGVSQAEAEKLKRGNGGDASKKAEVADIVDRKVEYVASEFNRQLSLFWNASGAEDGIDRIMVTGGGALVPGLLQELSEKTGIECGIIDPVRGLEFGGDFDGDYVKDVSSVISVCVGMGMRQPGDKKVVKYDA